MTPESMQVGPSWPPLRSDYDYTLTLARSDWAWEALRRNPHYQIDATSALLGIQLSSRLPSGVHLTRLLTTAPATSWGVRPFR